jgi:hypothetical protein
MKFDHLDKTKDLAHRAHHAHHAGGLKAHKALKAHFPPDSPSPDQRTQPNSYAGVKVMNPRLEKPQAFTAAPHPNLRPAGTDERTLAAEAPRASERSRPSDNKTHKSHQSSYLD